MDERVAKTEIDRIELGDRVDTLLKAVCSKIKRLAKVTGNKDLYRSPDPKWVLGLDRVLGLGWVLNFLLIL